MSKQFPVAQAFDEGQPPAIDLVPVVSNQIKAVGFDAATSTLAVTFTRGAPILYCYDGATPELHQAFMAAESFGKFFEANVRGKLAFRKYRLAAETA